MANSGLALEDFLDPNSSDPLTLSLSRGLIQLGYHLGQSVQENQGVGGGLDRTIRLSFSLDQSGSRGWVGSISLSSTQWSAEQRGRYVPEEHTGAELP